MSTVVVAGATGFVGQALLAALAPDPEYSENGNIIALSRSERHADSRHTNVTWRSCDLLSLLSSERAVAGADTAVYLVHSMMRPARLTQGRFEDLDLIAADNFGRAARAAGIKRIVYLGGLLPADGTHLSRHLASRREVELALAAHGVPVTVLRAGLVLGPGGSSFQILLRLVRRLPVMLCPAWTGTRTQPVALADVVAMLRACLTDEGALGLTTDLGGPEVLSYRELMTATARALGVERRLIPVPFFSPGLSSLWVRLVTGAPRELVAPLVKSLEHEMVAHDRSLQQRLLGNGTPVADALALAVAGEARVSGVPGASALARMMSRPEAPTVCSVQRLPLPQTLSAVDIADVYLHWLPKALRPLLDVRVAGGRVCSLRVAGFKRPLLELTLSEERSAPSRVLLYITGGALARIGFEPRGRLEFREVLSRRCLLAAVHDFRPRLPWRLYRATQAVAHLFVMKLFGRHLGRLAKRPSKETPELLSRQINLD